MKSKRVSKEEDLGSDLTKGDYARVPFKLWYRRAWIAKGNQVNAVLQILREVMLSCLKINPTQGLC